MVLRLRELPGVLHTDWCLGLHLEVLGYPVQDVAGARVGFKGPRGILLGSLWAEFLRHFWVHSWECIRLGALPEGALHSSTATVNRCCQPAASGVRSSLLSWAAGPTVKPWQPDSYHRHRATWAGPGPTQQQIVLSWLPQAWHLDLTRHLQDRTGVVQTQDRLRSASALPFAFTVLSSPQFSPPG